jgi:transposase
MALADCHGLPLSIVIAEGSRHDVVLTDRTLDAAFVDELPYKLIGDKAWDSNRLQKALSEERGIELVAPRRGGKRPSTRKQDGRSLRRIKRRWLVERLFAWLKQFRRLALRWDRKAENFLGLLQLGCIVVLLRRR